MLRVESFGQAGAGAAVVDATRVLIRDGHGNPICVAVSWSDGPVQQTLVAHIGDEEFDDLLATFGTKRARVVTVAAVGPDGGLVT